MQTVDRERNPRFHRLMQTFYKLTGCPVLVNTSFNVRGEPIVCTPEEAYRCFLATEMDALVLENMIVLKSQLQEQAPGDKTRAEYLAQFRSDVEGFVLHEIVEACVGDFHEMLPMAGFVYSGFVDPSGGSDAAMTLAIGHKTTTAEKQIVIDVIREVRPPFDPVAVVDNFAALLKTYRISKVLGDHYGGDGRGQPAG